jgi:hypothetical protein
VKFLARELLAEVDVEEHGSVAVLEEPMEEVHRGLCPVGGKAATFQEAYDGCTHLICIIDHKDRKLTSRHDAVVTH